MSLGAAAKNRFAFARESLKSRRYTRDTSTFESTPGSRETEKEGRRPGECVCTYTYQPHFRAQLFRANQNAGGAMCASLNRQ